MIKRRILIINNRVSYPLNDGGNLAVHAMIEGYKKAGWEVAVLAMNTTRHHVAESVLKNLYTDIHSFETVDVDNSIRPLPMLKNFLLTSEPHHVKRFQSASFAQKLEKALRDFDPHVVQVESIYLTGYVNLIREVCNAKVVLRLHNIENHIWQRFALEKKNLQQFYFNNLAKRVRHFEHSAWDKYDLLLPITAKDANVVKRHVDQDKIYVVPYGIDTSKIHSCADEKWEGYHIGAMDWVPNSEAIKWFLNKVWPYVHNLAPDFKFYFAGRNMPSSFRHLHIPNVICAGEVPDANAFIADKKILILPLRSGGGIRIKALEAMAAGKIVISTDQGMQGIDAVAGEHYIAANEPKEFAKAINWCRIYRKESQEIAENGAGLVRSKYDINLIMEGLVSKMNELLQA